MPAPADRGVLHFVRHGETSWNVEGRVQGQADAPGLTEAGRRQAAAAAGLLRDCPSPMLYTSDLRRAVETAEPIAALLGVATRRESALREQALGSLEGKLAAHLAEQDVPPGERVTSVRWGGGESIADLHERVSRFLGELAPAAGGKHVVLVAHGDLIRVAVAALRGTGPHEVDWFEVPNGCVVTVGLPASFSAPDLRLD